MLQVSHNHSKPENYEGGVWICGVRMLLRRPRVGYRGDGYCWGLVDLRRRSINHFRHIGVRAKCFYFYNARIILCFFLRRCTRDGGRFIQTIIYIDNINRSNCNPRGERGDVARAYYLFFSKEESAWLRAHRSYQLSCGKNNNDGMRVM